MRFSLAMHTKAKIITTIQAIKNPPLLTKAPKAILYYTTLRLKKEHNFLKYLLSIFHVCIYFQLLFRLILII